MAMTSALQHAREQAVEAFVRRSWNGRELDKRLFALLKGRGFTRRQAEKTLDALAQKGRLQLVGNSGVVRVFAGGAGCA